MKSIDSRDLGPIIGGIVVTLMGLGTVMVFSAGANLTGELELEHFYDFTTLRQLIFFPLAVAIMYILSTVDYHRLGFRRAGVRNSLTTWLLVLTIFFLMIVLTRIGVSRNNARRWLSLPLGVINLSFQPSELAKWVVIFFIAACVDKFGETMGYFKTRFVPICGIIGVMVALILKEDFGTAAFICLITFILLLFGGAKWWHMLSPLPFAIAAGAAVIMTSPARRARIEAFLHPDANAGAAAYQATQSLIAIATGGIWGKGLGHGVCKYGHLPEDTTDFIFAIIGEELGFIGVTVLILLFLAFVFLGMLVVIRCRDKLGQMLAAGIVSAVGIQAAVNIGVATVVLPTKGIGLPFVSAGGTSMLLSAAGVGVLLNIARQLDSPAGIIGRDGLLSADLAHEMPKSAQAGV
jgi:cell division protein FtsW